MQCRRDYDHTRIARKRIVNMTDVQHLREIVRKNIGYYRKHGLQEA